MSILSVVGEIDRCGRAINAVAEIKRLHAPVDLGLIYPVCAVCCRDEFDGSVSQDCMTSHDHLAGAAVCATAEILERAGL